MTEKQPTVNIICSLNLPVKIIDDETGEVEESHMLQEGNTLYVSKEVFDALNKKKE